MACSSNLEPMDQDDTPQVSETCGTLDFNLDDELDLEADDLEITEFTRVYGGDKVTDGRQTTSRPKERITISVINSDFNHDPKEDGELSGSQSESDAADMHSMFIVCFSLLDLSLQSEFFSFLTLQGSAI